MTKDQIKEAFGTALITLEGVIINQFVKENIQVEVGGPLIQDTYLEMAVASHLAIIGEDLDAKDPSVFERYDHDAYMKHVSEITLKAIETIRNNMKARHS